MGRTSRIHVLAGGPYHPVAKQFAIVQTLLGDAATVTCHDGTSAFDDLGNCDLFVAGGLHWTGLDAAAHPFPEGVASSDYRPPNETQKRAFTDYVSSGRPVLAWHGGIGSFDDWPEFGQLLGFAWIWGTTSHSAYGPWHVDIEPTGHPAVTNVGGYDIVDELYYDVQVAPGMTTAVHATADYDGARRPMVITAEGGRIAGSGRSAFLANGHDSRALDSEQFCQVIVNTIGWLLDQ
jgi:type 1 glutamine amidotransferase